MKLLSSTRPTPSTSNDTEARPWAMLMYGVSGIGKTSFAAQAKNVLFIVEPQDRGIQDLLDYHQCPKPVDIWEAETWSELRKLCDKAATTKGVEHVAFDNLTGLEQLCFIHHCKEYYNDDWSSAGFYAYQQGPKNAAKRDWPDLIQWWETLRNNGKKVMVLAHSQVKTFHNPSGADFDKYSPYCDKETWAATHKWAPMVLFYKDHVETKKEGARQKANPETARRIICCSPAPEYDAKHRHGLPPVINAGSSAEEAWTNFMKALKARQ